MCCCICIPCILHKKHVSEKSDEYKPKIQKLEHAQNTIYAIINPIPNSTPNKSLMISDISFDQKIDEGNQDSFIETKSRIDDIAIDDHEDDEDEDNVVISGQHGFMARTSYTIPTKATTSFELLYDTFDIETIGKTDDVMYLDVDHDMIEQQETSMLIAKHYGQQNDYPSTPQKSKHFTKKPRQLYF